MNHKSLYLTTLAAFVASSTFAAPALQFGDGIQLHVLGAVEYTFDDNIFRQSDGDEDSAHSLAFTPGVELRFMERGAASAKVSYRHTFETYTDHDQLDNDYADLRGQAQYDSGVLMVKGHGSFRQRASNRFDNPDIPGLQGDLVERDEIKAGADVRYEISELLAASSSVLYEDKDYEDRGLTDFQSYSIPLMLIYKFQPKLELNAGVQYRITNTDNSTQLFDFDYDDLYYFVGAVGELFTPVLYGDVSVGFLERDFKDMPLEASSTSYDATITYVGDVKTTVYLTLSRDYRNSAFQGSNYVLTQLALGARYSLTDFIGFNASVSTGDLDYDKYFNPATGQVEENPRSQDMMTYSIGTSYRPNDYLTVTARYVHNDVDGNDLGGAREYANSQFRVSASVRY